MTLDRTSFAQSRVISVHSWYLTSLFILSFFIYLHSPRSVHSLKNSHFSFHPQWRIHIGFSVRFLSSVDEVPGTVRIHDPNPLLDGMISSMLCVTPPCFACHLASIRFSFHPSSSRFGSVVWVLYPFFRFWKKLICHWRVLPCSFLVDLRPNVSLACTSFG